MKNILISIFVCLCIGASISKFLEIKKDVNNSVLTVELIVFSGENNFKLFLNSEEVDTLYSLIEENKYKSNNSIRVMGYKGWRLVELNIVIFGYPIAESFLLEKFKGSLPDQVYNHIIEIMQNEYEEGENMPTFYSNRIFSTVCDQTPIRGGNHYPDYNPQTDDKGCFIEKQWDNNCYNYGTDVLTNTFAQPGRGTSHKWVVNTCEDVKRAAISDGLIFKGDSFSEELSEGHYVAMFIWPNTNFHWVRLDSNGFWSHKAGGTPVKNVDNSGSKITDPSKSDFSPWTQFCGYFQVIPSNININ